MGSVGGPRQSARQGLPGAGWQCPICNSLVVGDLCPTCKGDPNWRLPGLPVQPRRPGPYKQPTGAEQAREAMQALTNTEPARATEPNAIELRLSATGYDDGRPTSVFLYGPLGESYHGEGATLQEATYMAIAALEEDQARPKCPVCGQAWPEDLALPTSDE